MKCFRLSFISLVIGILFLLSCKGPSVEVKVGKKVVCRYCGKVLLDSTRIISVPQKYAPKYQDSLVVVQSMCDSCGAIKESVKYGKVYICPRCGKVLKDRTKTIIVARSDAHKYQVERILAKNPCSACKAAEARRKHTQEVAAVRKNPTAFLKIKKHSWKTDWLGTATHYITIKNESGVRIKDIMVRFTYSTKTETDLPSSFKEPIYEILKPHQTRTFKVEDIWCTEHARKSGVRIVGATVAE